MGSYCFCSIPRPLNSPWQYISSLFSMDGQWDMSPANFRKTHVGLSATPSSPRLPYSLQSTRSHRSPWQMLLKARASIEIVNIFAFLPRSGEDAVEVRAKFRNCVKRFGILVVLNFDQTPNAWLTSERYATRSP
jgi:hypothetical protein